MDQNSESVPSRDSTAVSNPLQKLRATCDACNQAKVKCSKNKPSCSRCTSHDIPCVYGISRAGKHRRPSRASKSISGNPLLSPFQHQFIFENIQSSDIPYDENIFPTGSYPFDQASASTGFESPYTASARTSGDYSDFSMDNLNDWGTSSYTSNPASYSVSEVSGVGQEVYLDQNNAEWQIASTQLSPIGYTQDTSLGHSFNGIPGYNAIDSSSYHSDAGLSSAPPSPESYLTSPTIQTSPDLFDQCSCYQSIVQGVQLLQSISFPLSDIVLEYAMDRSRDANGICSAALECPCSFRSNRTHVLLLASLLAKSIATIRAIYSFLKSPYASTTLGGVDACAPAGNRMTDASFNGCNAEAMLQGHGESISHMVLVELNRVEALVYQFVQIFLQPLRIRQAQIGVGQDLLLEKELRTYESVSLHLQAKLGEMTSLVIMNGEGQSTILG
ncbi:hypothetical protein BJ508DRAFT_356890 [Ascobolus immersus RN42]|uniref:Zn(2)-C6 fungal-type domain-containing protein n=1 Tax=Ascobolus immersus RN42 TaxID=1160509 RepID=A0A3N4IPN3_ASCIM|nr:hypothetical protein BJ508DRAFT_356890 [Ascobolus immersus RN42]